MSVKELFKLDGKVALITGGSRGLGLQMAEALAEMGCRLAITARKADELDEARKHLEAMGAEVLTVTNDLSDTAGIPAMVEQVVQRYGTIDILVNNAGLPDARHATKMPVPLIDAVLDTNVRGPFILSCEVARRLIAAKQPGRIVNISSSSAFHYTGNGAALYSVTKAAMVRMTEVLAVEWAAFGINVNAIAPGAFHSEMMDGMLDRMGDISARFPRGRVCDPALLTSTLLFLCAPASEAVTGTTIRVDDGQSPR